MIDHTLTPSSHTSYIFYSSNNTPFIQCPDSISSHPINDNIQVDWRHCSLFGHDRVGGTQCSTCIFASPETTSFHLQSPSKFLIRATPSYPQHQKKGQSEKDGTSGRTHLRCRALPSRKHLPRHDSKHTFDPYLSLTVPTKRQH